MSRRAGTRLANADEVLCVRGLPTEDSAIENCWRAYRINAGGWLQRRTAGMGHKTYLALTRDCVSVCLSDCNPEIFMWCARDRRNRAACAEDTRRMLTACCPSHRLKQAASIIFRRRVGNAYPSSRAHLANPAMCADSGPSNGRERTTSSSIMHFMVDSLSFDPGGPKESDYVDSGCELGSKKRQEKGYLVIVRDAE